MATLRPFTAEYMKHVTRSWLVAGAAAFLLAAAPWQRSQPARSTSDLVGLWRAKRHFGPDVRGRLVVERARGMWRAAIAGREATVVVSRDTVSFRLPDSSGAFTGRFDARRTRIVGQWVQSRGVAGGSMYSTPLLLAACGSECFFGNVVPLDEEFTLYMKVTRRPDGTLGAFIRNPERNLGRRIRLDRIEQDGAAVRWLDAKGDLIFTGVMRDDVMSVYIGNRGGTYDFVRVPAGSVSDFYPTGRPTAAYSYAPPRAENDGWPVATVEQVGLSRELVSAFMQALANTPDDSVGSLQVHGILIARHGKLVVEEYFHGEHADKPHDTRSAAKSVAAVLIGAAMHAGVKIGPATPVFSVMRPAARDLEPRKRALTLEHLLTMSSGLDCDDNQDESPGNEDNITQQDTNPDWYRMILDLGMIRDPGVHAVYCSINPHLAGGVLSRAAHRPLPEMMWDLVGEPLQMRHYYMPLTPLGDAYMGGGMRFRPRDFMKLGQLYLNGGMWHGRRVLAEDWVRRSTQSRYPMGRDNTYGYLWWVREYSFQGRTIRAYFASGNGGNEVMVFPELDLVLASYGGNYSDGAANWATVRELVPRYVLPAVLPQR